MKTEFLDKYTGKWSNIKDGIEKYSSNRSRKVSFPENVSKLCMKSIESKNLQK